jgi:hypothetical protein
MSGSCIRSLDGHMSFPLQVLSTKCFSLGVMPEGTYVSTSLAYIPRTSTTKSAHRSNPLSSGQRPIGFS